MLMLDTDRSQRKEEEAVNNLKTMGRKIVRRNHVLFNGESIAREEGNVIWLIQDNTIDKIRAATTQKAFSSRKEEC